MPARRIPAGGTRGTLYRDIARLRQEDAFVLLKRGRYNGSIYLAGYAIECYLKFAICRRKEHVYLPAKFEVHDWDRLINEAGLLPEIRAQRNVNALYSSLADSWGPTLRYRTTMYAPREATRIFTEITQLYRFLTELVP
jgi:hypothetical protein